jgi:hypothetical protein
MAISTKIDLLIQFILAVAGQEDEGGGELGMIHLIKYAYLADLAYAEHHNGETYTGIPWKFHHYGPWSEEVFLRIEPALAAINAQKREFYSSTYDKDLIRWSVPDHRLYDQLERKMDLGVAGTIQKYVHKFGADTTGLLHYVYQTPPMLQAAPEAFLDFGTVIRMKAAPSPETDILEKDTMTVRQMKRRKEKLLNIKKRLNERLNKKLRELKIHPKPPRYDDVYFEGLRQLDELVGNPIEPMECTAVFGDDVWKSKARFDPDVSR